MSDIIRESSKTVIITTSDAQESDLQALKDWGNRVWTIPEILLSQGSEVTWVHMASETDAGDEADASVNGRKDLSKVHLAQRAWHDASEARQLVEHFTNLHLSRLELSSIALQCLQRRVLKQKHPGDRSYALMGLLRLRPLIDSEDSAFQAFARSVGHKFSIPPLCHVLVHSFALWTCAVKLTESLETLFGPG